LGNIEEKIVLFVSPVDINILKNYVKGKYDNLKCEVCDKKLKNLDIILHKDFFLCGNCALEHKLVVKTINFYIYLSELEI